MIRFRVLFASFKHIKHKIGFSRKKNTDTVNLYLDQLGFTDLSYN